MKKTRREKPSGNTDRRNRWNSCPDLVEAIGDNGVVGYLRMTESLGKPPASPEEALAMQNANYKPRVISLYAKDDVTILDTFTIGANE